MSDGEARQIERQVEADDRGAKIVGNPVEHFVDELVTGLQLGATLGGNAAQDFDF